MDPEIRPGQGFAGHTARRLRLEHEALAHVFKDWDIRTRDAVQLYWGGLTLRLSKVYLAAVVVDHPGFILSSTNTLDPVGTY